MYYSSIPCDRLIHQAFPLNPQWDQGVPVPQGIVCSVGLEPAVREMSFYLIDTIQKEAMRNPARTLFCNIMAQNGFMNQEFHEMLQTAIVILANDKSNVHLSSVIPQIAQKTIILFLSVITLQNAQQLQQFNQDIQSFHEAERYQMEMNRVVQMVQQYVGSFQQPGYSYNQNPNSGVVYGAPINYTNQNNQGGYYQQNTSAG